MRDLSETEYQQRMLHATRALGIFFIRSAFVALVGVLVTVTAFLIITFADIARVLDPFTVLWLGVIGIAIAQIVVVVQANHELRRSGDSRGIAREAAEYFGFGPRT